MIQVFTAADCQGNQQPAAAALRRKHGRMEWIDYLNEPHRWFQPRQVGKPPLTKVPRLRQRASGVI